MEIVNKKLSAMMVVAGLGVFGLANADTSSLTGYIAVPYTGHVQHEQHAPSKPIHSSKKTEKMGVSVPAAELAGFQALLLHSHSPYRYWKVSDVGTMVPGVRVMRVTSQGVTKSLFLVDSRYVRPFNAPAQVKGVKGINCTKTLMGPRPNIHQCYRPENTSYWIVGSPKEGTAVAVPAKDGPERAQGSQPSRG